MPCEVRLWSSQVRLSLDKRSQGDAMQTLRLKRRMRRRAQKRTRRREWKARAVLAAQMIFFGVYICAMTVLLIALGGG